MKPVIDPETYLRLTCEQSLAADPNQQRRSAITVDVLAAARAFVVTGYLDKQVALAIVDEYRLAFGLRGNHPIGFISREDDEHKETLTGSRVAVGDFEIDGGEGHLLITKIIFTDDETRLTFSSTRRPESATARRAAGPRSLTIHRTRPHPADLRVIDDQGTTVVASPSAWSGSDRSSEGTYRTQAPLSPETTWIDIDGTRIELPPVVVDVQIRVEAVEPGRPIARALFQEVTSGFGGPSSLEASITALESIGALAPDDPDVAAARLVAKAMETGTPARGAGPRWDALLRRWSASDGPVGRLPLGIAVESVAGCSIRFDSLDSAAEGFAVDLSISPGSVVLPHFAGLRFDLPLVTWWAEDDLQNVYLGVPNNYSGSPSRAECTVAFSAPLDPRASVVRLLPTGQHERAVVTISLDGLGSPS